MNDNPSPTIIFAYIGFTLWGIILGTTLGWLLWG